MKTIAFYVISLLLISHCASGQESNNQLKIEESKKISLAAPASSSGTGFLSGFSFTKLTASNDGTSAEANIGFTCKKWTFNFKSTVPVISKSTIAKPLTIAGLDDGASVSVGLQRLFFKKDFAYNKQAYNDYVANWRRTHIEGDFNTDNLSPEELRDFRNQVRIEWGIPVYVSANFSLSQKSYKYFTDSLSFAILEDNNINVKGSGTLGLVTYPGIFALSLTYKRGISANDPVKYYAPIKSTGILTEFEAIPGKPSMGDDFRMRLDFLTNETLSNKIFVNPNITALVSQRKLAFELPLYFLSDKELGFLGGIFASYVTNKEFDFGTEKKNFGFGLFVGGSVSNLLSK